MLLKVGQFCSQVDNDLAGLIDELAEITNRNSPNEKLAWQNSLPKLSMALTNAGLHDFHIALTDHYGVSLEYKLPAASAWCDAVLLGEGSGKPTAVVIELKDWDTKNTQPTNREALVKQNGVYYSHPSDQVRGYVEYIQNFHSTILKYQASVSGCTFFTRAKDLSSYTCGTYERLVNEYPVFAIQEEDGDFSKYIKTHLIRPNNEFAKAFEKGKYSQSRSLIDQVASLINDETKTNFVLLDEQRLGFELCLSKIDEILNNTQIKDKAVIIIEGPPGSGKSVLAAKLWAALAKDQRIAGNIVLTSTSSAQNSNWKRLFERQAKKKAARGIVIRSNDYKPGIPGGWVKRKRGEGYTIDVQDWKENLRIFHEEYEDQIKDNSMEVSIVDEAHALIDPSVPDRGGIKNAGWTMVAGPQGYHIIRASRISIFLMDSDQSYRDNETTTKKNLQNWAIDLGVKRENIQEISLGNSQFRCGGSKEYVEWLENALQLYEYESATSDWRLDHNGKGQYLFEIVKDPLQLDEKLTIHKNTGKTVRLGASYSRGWITKGIEDPFKLPGNKKDFCIPYTRDGKMYHWEKIWNYVPGNKDYSHFIQGISGSNMEDDPLGEVGCPYVVRGFDFDFMGVLWMDDLYWDPKQNSWQVNLENVYETAWSLTLARAKNEQRRGVFGPNTETVIRQLQRGYRILLSRAIHGVYVWFENPITKDHMESLLRP